MSAANKLIVLVVALLGTGTAAIAATNDLQCKGNPRVVDVCFTVHGRIGIYQGTPSVRMWVVGTKRVLGLYDLNAEEPGETAPPAVASYLMHDDNVVVFGDYEVCPLEYDHPGRMRAVCVEGASHLIPARWGGKSLKPEK